MTPGIAPPVGPRAVIALLSRLRSVQGQADPAPVLAGLRQLGDLVPSPWGGWLATSWDACDEIMRGRTWRTPDNVWRATQGERWNTVASREFSRMIMVLNPPEHTAQRRILGNAFDRTTLRRLTGLVERLVADRLDALDKQLSDGDTDFPEVVGEELPVAAVGGWLDLPAADYPLLRRLTHEQAYAQEMFPTPAQLAVADVAAVGLREYFTAVVAEHRAKPWDSPISRWLRDWDAVEPDRDVVDATVRRLATFSVMAGLETTSTLLSSAVWQLLRHPDQFHRLRANPRELPGAIEEVLRYDSPVQFASRLAGQDTVVGGVEVPAGQLMYAFLGSAHHDPRVMVDPERFDITRRAKHLAFGGGAHYCVGAGLGRLEAMVMLRSLLERFPDLRVSSVPEWEPRVAFRRMKSFRVAR